MKSGQVLVVDDDSEMRVSLGHLLESAGYETQLVLGRVTDSLAGCYSERCAHASC